MMRWIIKSSLRFRFIVLAGAVAMLGFGIGAIGKMPIDVFPEFSPPKVVIQTACIGLTSTEVEELVTTPMEQVFNGIPGLDVVRSKSAPQLSEIQLIFNTDVDLMRARQLVQERMAQVQNTLPTWAAPPVILQPLSATSRSMKVGITSETMSLEDLSMTTYWKIRGRLLQVPGVANVAMWGERIKAYQVEVDPGRLNTSGVTLDEVMEVTSQALDTGLLRFTDGAFIGTGGFLETPNQRLGVRPQLAIKTPEDLAQVPIAERDGKILRIGDVAEVVYAAPTMIGDAVIDGGPGLMLIIEKLPWGNTLEVTKGVEEAFREMAPGLGDIKVDTTIFRPASFVEEAIGHLGFSLLGGALLVVLVLILFLLDWRAALISVITMPLTLVATALVLYMVGATINTMVLAGIVIAIGAVVDDAIVDVENIVRRLRVAKQQGLKDSIASIVLSSSLEVRGAVVYASLIEALALAPIFFLTGLSGSFFRPLAMTYALAVIVSLGVAMLSTPALSLILFSRSGVSERESPITRWLQSGYARLLTPFIKRPLPVYGTVFAMTVAGLFAGPRLGEEFFPELKERDFLMHWLTFPGTSLDEEVRMTRLGAAELEAIPGVRNFGAHIGQAMMADEVVGVEFGENWISIDPNADYDETHAAVEELVATYPGMFTDVQTYLTERMNEVIGGSSEPVTIRIVGPSLDVLRSKGAEVKAMLETIPGIVDAHVEQQKLVPQIEVDVDIAKARSVGLIPGDIRRIAATMIAGEEIGDIFRDGKTYDVQVWSTPESRDSIDDLRNLILDTPSGKQVTLGDVATVTIAPEVNVVRHENSNRRIDVGANVKGRDLGSVTRDVEAGLAKIDFPLEHRPTLIGTYQERQRATDRMFGFAAIAIIGIMLILWIVLRRPRLAVLSFITLPLALLGGVLATYAFGLPISIGSQVGFFTILGIVARNGIMMVSHFQHLELEEGVPFGPDLIIQGARERIAPIMMTALTTGLALIPLIISGNIAGQEIEYPMAVVIVGGLVAATLINLFMVPLLYLRFGKTRKERMLLA